MNPVSIAQPNSFLSYEKTFSQPRDLLDTMNDQIRSEKFMEFHQTINKFSRENESIDNHQLNRLLGIRNLLLPFQNSANSKLVYVLNSVALIEVLLLSKNQPFKT